MHKNEFTGGKKIGNSILWSFEQRIVNRAVPFGFPIYVLIIYWIWIFSRAGVVYLSFKFRGPSWSVGFKYVFGF
jgi:hypothetical protein